MENTFCPKCGSKQEGNAFCSKCGNRLVIEKHTKPKKNSDLSYSFRYINMVNNITNVLIAIFTGLITILTHIKNSILSLLNDGSPKKIIRFIISLFMFSGAFVVIDWIGDLDSEYRGYTAIFIFILMLFSTISNNIFKLFSRLIIPFAGVLLAIVIVLYVFFALEWI